MNTPLAPPQRDDPFSPRTHSLPRGRLTAFFSLLILAMAVVVRGQPIPTLLNDGQFGKDLEAFATVSSRTIGSDGYDRAGHYLQSQFAALGSAIEWRCQEFAVMVPVTTSASLQIPSQDHQAGQTVPVFPFWPAGVRLNSTPAEGITGRAVYCGNATYSEIHPASLKGQIAVVEASARENWRNAPYFGARAVILLGSAQTTHVDLESHDLLIPVDLPRFYLPPGRLADDLRAGRIAASVTLKAHVNWKRATARNYFALVKPRVPRPDRWTGSQTPAALMISVPYESSSLVPDLSPGASQAAQAAAGLAILRQAAEHPLDRPVVVFFSGADSIQFLGTRNMFMALADVPRTWTAEQPAVTQDLASARRDRDRLREVIDRPAALDVGRDRASIDRVVKVIEGELSLVQDELFRLRRKADHQQSGDDRARLADLERRQVSLNQLRYALQQRPASAAQRFPAEVRQFLEETRARLGDSRGGLIAQLEHRQETLQQRIDLYRWLARSIGRDPDPSDRANNSRLIELLVALDLTDGGVRAGPLYWGWFQRTSNITQIQDYRDYLARADRALTEQAPEARWLAPLKAVLDFEPLSAARSPASWLGTTLPLGSEMGQAWGVPAFSMVTLDDPRLRRDTPADTLDRLEKPAILRQLNATWALLRHAWNDPAFKGQPEFKWMRNGFEGQVVGTSPGRPVPDLPRPGFLATYYYAATHVKKIAPLRPIPYTLGIRRSEVRDCDAEGRYRFEALPRIGATSIPELALFWVHAYQVQDDTGRITATSDLGRQSADIKQYADIQLWLDPFRTVVFPCESFTLTGLYDPRFLQTLNEVIPLDARKNAEPQRYNALLFDQMMAGFVEPGAKINLVFRYGRIGNRLLLINMPGDAGAGATGAAGSAAQARGYSADELNNLGPLAVATARDFHRLDQARIDDYARAGVSSTLIDSLHAEAGRQIEQAEAALSADDGAALMEAANGAWANNARVYLAVDDLARDVVRAAIFLLLLCVPFAFCMERLLIGTPSIYRQIAGACAIFALMAMALWSFHPAFRISSSPLIIILAFAIIFMSIVVIAVVYSKFDVELKRLRSGRQSPQASSFARASVLTSAVLLGIANMRRRKFRTALTAVTVLLITFAVLCFTSATRYVGTTMLPTSVESRHPGVMLRQRGYRPIPPVTVENLRPLVAPAPIVERWWNIDPGDPKRQLHLVKPGGQDRPPTVVPVQAALGLTPGDAGNDAIAGAIGHEAFQSLARGQANVIYFSRSIADQLGAAEGDIVQLEGFDLRVAGIFDAATFDREALALSGESLAPLKYTTGAIDAGGRQLADTEADSFDLDADASASEASSAYAHLSSAGDFVIVPAAVSRKLPNATLRSIEIPLKSFGDVEPVSDLLSKRLAVALFAGFADGVRLVSAGNLASVSGAGNVAVPLAIAGLIIFNTMMGSIAERKREIHIYTSLGLAPLHIGALFLAEAAVYGLIGAVAGYVLGQGAAALMLKIGWLGSVTLNYSGTSAIITMALVLVIVLASAIVPARLASRLAAPSIERSWKVPTPQGDLIEAHLPFTISRSAADGALAYLADFFDAHREGSIGRFSVGPVEAFRLDSGERGLKTTVWLTPFDLGVRQDLTLRICPGQFPDIFDVDVRLIRLSGDDGNWHRMNKTFLTELRQQFLQWRNLSPQRMLEYIEESRGLFEKAEGSG